MTRKKIFSYIFFIGLLVLAIGLIYMSLGKNAEWVVSEKPVVNDLKQQSVSDLSYISIHSNKETEFTLLDSSGNQVGEIFTEGPLVNPVTKQPAGLPIKNLLYRKPRNGKYSLKIITQVKSNFWMEILLYDKNGESIKKTIEDSRNGIVNLKINLDKDNIRNSSID